MNGRIFVCEEENNRVGIGVILPCGHAAGAFGAPFDQMVLQIKEACQIDNMEEIITAIEEGQVVDREQFFSIVSQYGEISQLTQEIEEVPNCPMITSDSVISYDEAEATFIAMNPENGEEIAAAIRETLHEPELTAEVVEPEVTEVEDNNGLIQLIEQEIDNIGSDDDITENPIIFNLIQDNDTYHKRNIGIIPENQETNLDITEEEHQSLFSRLIDKLTRR